MTTMTGWQCPVCGRVWAPYVAECQGQHARPAPPSTSTPLIPEFPQPTSARPVSL